LLKNFRLYNNSISNQAIISQKWKNGIKRVEMKFEIEEKMV